MSDADGDSTMHSSPRSSVSDDLFPGADTTTTATTNTANTNLLDGGGVPLPSTPAANVVKTAELSPPNSQGAPGLGSGGGTAGPADATTINANGKRVYYAPNSGAALTLEGDGKGKAALDLPGVSASASTAAAAGELDAGVDAGAGGAGGGKAVVPSVHAASGYRWEREADAPGWAWKNKKAQEDWYKAEESFVERERMVRARYGDPLLEGAGAGQLAG
ncbi:uncharacterized protein IWZ02DRAFT_440867 [Phyllosticta citriasiana]|uniref:Uncharacterized protein n=1 Tax=Phyllosticta citriasiana TaxID=595635 RepID=A0ABR1KAU3_9PEZI